MGCDLDLVARLCAYERGQAIRIASHLQVALQPDALVMSPLSMAGEDGTIHLVALGRVASPPEFLFVPDPRMPEFRDRLFGQLGTFFWEYFQSCRGADTYPQVWVSSSAVVTLVDILGDAFRFAKGDPMIRKFGECMGYLAERYPIAGQQSLVTATGALRQHFVTGQSPDEDEHLGKLLTWICPPPSESVLIAATRAGEKPMGTKTHPLFDRDVLRTLVQHYHRARRREDSPSSIAAIERKISEALGQIASEIYQATQRAIRELQSASLPVLPDLPAMEAKEIDAFNAFMADRDSGFSLPNTDKPRMAACKLAIREDAEKNFRAALVLGSASGQVRAKAKGIVLAGEVVDVGIIPSDGRARVISVEILSHQRSLRVRKRDRFFWTDDPRLCFIVTGAQRIGRTTLVSMRIKSGMRSIGPPVIGSLISLAPEIPEWDRIGRILGKIIRRTRNIHWTHDNSSVPPATPNGTAPPDPLADLEALR